MNDATLREGWDRALTRRIERFYEANPDEWLTWEDLCIKFDCTKNQATGALQSLRADGRLAWEIVAVVRIKALET